MNEIKYDQCCALTKKGLNCKNKKIPYSSIGFCVLHHEKKDTKHYNSGIDCPICMEQIINPLKMEQCGHYFCSKCISQWMYEHKTCPYCRQEVTFRELVKATFYGFINKELVYTYRHIYDSNILSNNEYSLLITDSDSNSQNLPNFQHTKFIINKEYSEDEWWVIKNYITSCSLDSIFYKMECKSIEIVSNVSENIQPNIFIII
jgi:hypothetical protein